MSIKIEICDLSHPDSFVCSRVKFWFRRHGLSWEDFKANGIDLDTLHGLNDQRAMIDKLEVTARKRLGLEVS